MTARERFIRALTRKPLRGRVPHFELVFFLTMEALGKIHPLHRTFEQWEQMSEQERGLQRGDIADTYIAIARKYDHSAIFIMSLNGGMDEYPRLIDLIREKTGDEYFIMMHGDATFPVPSGSEMQDFTYRLADEPEQVKNEAHDSVCRTLEEADKLCRHGGLDGFALCADYCLNTGPFLSPAQFSEFVTPYLVDLVQGYRERGFYTIKHTDGNIMPILDQLIEARPDALHSLDPQAGVDIAEVKALAGEKVSLIGNVNCGLMQTGTDEEVADSVRYALRSGMPGGGYIFSTSNCIYSGMRLSRYEMMLDIWREEGSWTNGA